MTKNDKKKITQTEQPTVQSPAPAEPTLNGERQQFGQPVQQGFGGGSLGVNTDLNNPTTATASPTEQATPATPAKSATQELIDSIKAGSEEERQKIEKRRQAEETISGIADMGKALSNLYFTGKGAPNMYDPKTAMTPKARERYERALKNWEKNRAASMQYALSKQNADLKEESNRIAQGRLEEQERHNKVVEGRQNKEYELRKAKFEFDKYFKGESLKQKDRIAKMNDTLRRWQTERRFSQAQMAHLLASYDEYEWRDEQGNKHKTRVVQNPKTGYYSVEEDVEKGTTASGNTTTAKPSSGNRPKRQFNEIDISK